MTYEDERAIFDKLLFENNGKQIIVLPSSQKAGVGQCFDVTVKFTDMLGIPHYPGNPSPFPYANACQIYTDFGQFQAQYFDRIPNTTSYVPQKGDILVWDAKLNGGIGHTAVATGEGDVNRFKSLDQNWNIGAPAQIITHNYSYLLGALRLKITPSQPMANTQDQTLANEFKKVQDAFKKYGAPCNEAKDVTIYIDNLATQRDDANRGKQEKEKELSELNEKLETERSNHALELENKDKACDAKIQQIKDIPAKVETKVVTMPRQASNKFISWAIDSLFDLDDRLNKKSG